MNMLKQKSHFSLAVVVVAAAMLVAGGVLTASNTGFKLNKPLEPIDTTVPIAAKAGDNWTSVPYFNPYGTWGAFCTQLGLITSGLATARDQLLETDPNTGANFQSACGVNTTRPLVPGRGIKIRRPSSITTQTSVIIVGSHNPSMSVGGPQGVAGSHVGDFWFAVPYHTTAVSAGDVCTQAGLWAGIVPRATVSRLNPVTGATTLVQCGTAAANALSLVLGEAVLLRDPHQPISFIPAHF
jgi:hypothetical protein